MTGNSALRCYIDRIHTVPFIAEEIGMRYKGPRLTGRVRLQYCQLAAGSCPGSLSPSPMQDLHLDLMRHVLQHSATRLQVCLEWTLHFAPSLPYLIPPQVPKRYQSPIIPSKN